MTLTYPALARARQILWLVTGADKKDASCPTPGRRHQYPGRPCPSRPPRSCSPTGPQSEKTA